MLSQLTINVKSPKTKLMAKKGGKHSCEDIMQIHGTHLPIALLENLRLNILLYHNTIFKELG